MARIDPLKREDMNDEQGQAYDEVVARAAVSVVPTVFT